MTRLYPDRPIVGVGAVVWRGDRVLLVRRGKPPRQGQWSLPGGAQQLGETLREAVTREVREETGLELSDLRLLTTVDLVDRDPDGRVRYHYTLVDFTAEAPLGEPVAGDDAAAVAWFALDELPGLGLWTETLRIIEDAACRRGPEEPAVRERAASGA
jgi:8-oxo-dGTP diphosphatase